MQQQQRLSRMLNGASPIGSRRMSKGEDDELAMLVSDLAREDEANNQQLVRDSSLFLDLAKPAAKLLSTKSSEPELKTVRRKSSQSSGCKQKRNAKTQRKD